MLKKEVAKTLGCSEKTVERHVNEGRLSQRYEKTPGARGKSKAVFDKQEVLKLKQELKQPTYLSIPEVANDLSQINSQLLNDERLDCIKQGFNAWGYNQYLSSLQQKLLLKIKEASDLTGFSQSGIKRAIKDNRLRAIKEGGAWKISKVDLFDFIAIECQFKIAR
jgi:excisionase family DNA binding protein